MPAVRPSFHLTPCSKFLSHLFRIEGSNAYHWVFRCKEAVVHHAAPTRAAAVVHAMMAGHQPEVWLSDRDSAQQGHGQVQQTCLAHLARDVAYVLEVSDDPVPFRLTLWLASAFELADSISQLAASTLVAKRRALAGRLVAILAAPTTCDLVITHPCFGRSDQAVTVCRMVLKTLVPGLRRAVSTTLRMSASPSAAHMAR